jgi:hypothetical protein
MSAVSMKYGVADPMVSDILKTLTLQAVGGVGIGQGLRIPTMGEITGITVSMAIYYYVVHPNIGDHPLEKIGFK